MSLLDYNWQQHDLDKTRYAGKYTTHDAVNKHSIVEQLDQENDLEFKEHTLTYEGKEMEVRLDVTHNYASFFYDEVFEEEFGDQDFEEVILYFLTPEQYRFHYTDF